MATWSSLGPGHRRYGCARAAYKLRATKEGKPVHLDRELVTITRGDKQVVRVAVQADALAEPVDATFVTPWSDSDDWAIDGQELVQLNGSASSHHLLFGDPNWTDYNFEADVEIKEGGSEVGLMFRATAWNERLNATLLPATKGIPEGNAFFPATKGIREQGQLKVLAVSRHTVGVPAGTIGEITTGRWYRMRVEARGSRFKVFLDGQQVSSVFNEGFPRGCLGLYTNTAAVRFRNLKVTDPEGKMLLKGVQGILPKATDDAVSNFLRGERFSRSGQWDKAAAAFDRGLKADPSDHERWCKGAALFARIGDVERYRRACRELITRFGESDQRVVGERATKACLLLPDVLNSAEFERVEKLAALAVCGDIKNDGLFGFTAFAKGIVSYRAGRYAEAVQWIERFGPRPDAGWVHNDAAALAVLAMAHHRLGHVNEAAAALAQVKSIIDQKMPDPPQDGWQRLVDRPGPLPRGRGAAGGRWSPMIVEIFEVKRG